MLPKIMTLSCFLAIATLTKAQVIGHLDAAGTPLLTLNESQIKPLAAKRVQGDVLKNYTLKAGTNNGKAFYYLTAERFKRDKLYSKIALPIREQNGKLLLISDRKRGCLMECIGANCEMTIKVPCETIECNSAVENQACNSSVTFK